MKTVLLFTHRLSGGGAEKTVRRLARYINEHDCGYRAVVCVNFDDPDYHDEVDDLKVLKARSAPTDNKIVRGINVFRQIHELRRIKKQLKADVCISFLPGADRINIRSGIGEKQVISIRVKESYFTDSAFRKNEIRDCSLKSDLVVSVSDYVKHDMIDFFEVPEQKIITIHNAIDPKDFAHQGDLREDISSFMNGHRVIINVGRLDVQKGQKYLIRAFAEVHKTHPDIVLVILGEGPLREELSELIKELGCEKSILLAGNVHDPGSYLKQADLFVLSSDVEGMPNVILEAMMADLPCISTECGSREILAPGTDVTFETDNVEYGKYGVLVPIRNEETLSEAILSILEDDDTRSGYIAKAPECLKEYSPEVIYQKWIDMLDKIMSK